MVTTIVIFDRRATRGRRPTIAVGVRGSLWVFRSLSKKHKNSSMDEPRYIILHGHFYQPPRQSPWTGLIAPEPSAVPFPNWNERILSECYNANAHAHTVVGQVAYIRNNYERLSFDFGPTLHSW